MRCATVTAPSRLAALLVALAATACSTTPSDPLATLKDNSASTENRLRAMEMLDAERGNTMYTEAMKRLVFQSGVVQPVRAACFDRLYAEDPDALLAQVNLDLPNLDALEWRRGICEKIAALDWKAATPALVRALGRPMKGWIREVNQRPEYQAIVTMYGAGSVGSVVFGVLVDSDPLRQANLRARCWELMFELGEESRLLQLLEDLPPESRDGMLIDLKRGWTDLGVLPRTREEVLWLRTLREPGRESLWVAAREAMSRVSASERRTMLMKDVGVVVAANALDPDALGQSREQLLERLASWRAAQGESIHSPDFRGYGKGHSERLHEHRETLTWGDAMAMLIMTRALEDPGVIRHLFDIAQRDHADRSTEYGGTIRLDAAGRPELVEFPAASRGSDTQFRASQEMFDASYTAIGQFHLHASDFENDRHAGPHVGDFGYADSTGVNGFVFTFLDSSELNVDWYRRGQVVVDLGVVKRP